MTPGPRLSRLHALLPWAVVGLAAAFVFRRLDDPDTFWHLAAGRWIAEHGAVPRHDTLSYTATERAWVNLQWLWDLALYGLWRVGGATALVLSATALVAGTFALLVVQLRRRLGPLATAGLAAWVLLAAQDRFAVRPELVSFLLLEVVLWLLGTMRESEGRRLWLLAPLMLVWVNVHALFAVGLFAIAATAVAAAGLPPAVRRRLWVCLGVACVATLANPYFLKGALFPLELLSRLAGSPWFAAIGELRSPFTVWFPDLTIGAFQLLFLAGSALAATAVLRRGGFALAECLVFTGLAVLAAVAYRNAALFALGAAPFMATWLAASRDLLPAIRAPRGAIVANVAAAAIAGLLACGFWFVTGNRYYRADGRTHEFGAGILEGSLPQKAAEFVDEFDLPGPLYNDLHAGGYLAWARPNGDRVFIDGRLEVYDDFYADYSTALVDSARWSRQAERFAFQTVVLFHRWSNRHPLIGWLARNPEWALVYFDETAVVFVRARGHDAEIARARAAFGDRYQETLARLERPTARWIYPVGRVTSWRALGALFQTLGEPARAADCYRAALALE